MIDHEDVHESLLRFQFEAKLLHGCEDGGSHTKSREDLAGFGRLLLGIHLHFQCELINSREPGLVLHLAPLAVMGWYRFPCKSLQWVSYFCQF